MEYAFCRGNVMWKRLDLVEDMEYDPVEKEGHTFVEKMGCFHVKVDGGKP